MKESDFQSGLIKEIEDRFPGAIVTKVEPYIQGIPDLLILHENHWAMLECKRDELAPHRPNQDYYVNKLNDMSYSSFVYPENKEKVLDELEQTFTNA